MLWCHSLLTAVQQNIALLLKYGIGALAKYALKAFSPLLKNHFIEHR